MKFILETERLILRPWKMEDAESLFKYASYPKVGPICGWTPHKDLEESRSVLQNILMVPETYAMVLKETGEAIGSISLMFGKGSIASVREGECELGYWLAYPYWGTGLTPEAAKELLRHAFEDLNCSGVWCGHFEGNLQSRRVMEKCGFVYDHTTEAKYRASMDSIGAGYVFYLSRENWLKNCLNNYNK